MSGVTRCTLLMVLYLDRMGQRGLHAVLWMHIGALMHRLAAEPCSTAELLFPSRCPSGTILLTPYSMVWDWRVSRTRPCFFIGLSCSIPTIVFYSFSLSLLSDNRLVLWGWGLWTDRVYITLWALHWRPFLIIIIIIIYFHFFIWTYLNCWFQNTFVTNEHGPELQRAKCIRWYTKCINVYTCCILPIVYLLNTKCWKHLNICVTNRACSVHFINNIVLPIWPWKHCIFISVIQYYKFTINYVRKQSVIFANYLLMVRKFFY